jgi:hypothetical protein
MAWLPWKASLRMSTPTLFWLGQTSIHPTGTMIDGMYFDAGAKCPLLLLATEVGLLQGTL